MPQSSDTKTTARDTPPRGVTRRRPHGRPWPIHVLLLPALPVLALWSGNASEIHSLLPAWMAMWSVLGALALAAIITIVQRDTRRTALIASAVLVEFGLHARLVPWEGRLGLLVAAALVAVVCLLAARLPDRILRHVTLILNAVGLALVVANLTVVMLNRPLGGSASLPEAIGVTATDQPAPDVWYIAPDRYPNLSVLEDIGIDTGNFGDALAQRAFTIIPNARANYPSTQSSLASAWSAQMLDIQHNDNLTAHAVELLKDPLIGQRFRDAGYTYLHLGTWFDATSTSESASSVLTLQLGPEFFMAYEQISIIPSLRAVTGASWYYVEDIFQRQPRHARHQLETLRRLAERQPDGREFVLAHFTLPHLPYVFKANGDLRFTAAPKQEAYEEQLTYFNDQLLEIFDLLLAREKPPIIVLLPDEGLYPEDLDQNLEKGDYDLGQLTAQQTLEKFSLTAAVFDPDPSRREAFPAGTTSVNIVRSVLNRALGTDLEPLPDVSYTWNRTSDGDLELVPADL